jgi:hypothetical protein
MNISVNTGEKKIKVMVKFFEERPEHWNKEGGMNIYMGHIIEVRHIGGKSYLQQVGLRGERVSWNYYKEDLIFCPEEDGKDKS